MLIAKNITIIGLGLIGGSLAKALKKHRVAGHITAYSKTSKSLDKAIKMGIIDIKSTNLQESVKDAEIVIICSPLGTYSKIIKEIASAMPKGCILTDAGSVKSCVAKLGVKLLSNEQLPYFIPAHPIAGSEKSGVEHSFAELYSDKKLIITPEGIVKTAVKNKIKKMWQNIGSKVEELSAKKHDEIYAQVSHAIHLLAFCYIRVVYKEKSEFKEILKSENINLLKFVRVAGSDSKMWNDIFLYNSKAIFNYLKSFKKELLNLQKGLKQSPEKINEEIIAARKIRMRLQANFPKTSSYDDMSPEVMTIKRGLPALIACALLKTTEENIKYAGTAFAGMTELVFHLPADLLETTFKNKDFLDKYTKSLFDEIDLLEKVIASKKQTNIKKYIEGSNKIYCKIVGK